MKILYLVGAVLFAGAIHIASTPSLATLKDADAVGLTPIEPNKSRCIETDQIDQYQTDNDQQVRLFLRNGSQFLLRLRQQCPQLHFHRYMSYTPVDGKICAGSNKIKTRAGLSCRIDSISPVAPAETDVPVGKRDVTSVPH